MLAASSVVVAHSQPILKMAESNGAREPPAADSTVDAAAPKSSLKVDEQAKDVQENSDSLNTANGEPAPDRSDSKAEAPVTKKSKVEPESATQSNSNATPPKKPNNLRPSLRGQYTMSDDGSGTWEGKWGMDDNAFNGGIVSPFSYTSKPVEADTNNSAGIQNALFTGYFMLGSTIPGNPSTKHEEKDISFQFVDDSNLPEGILKVAGQGKNNFGVFELDGTYDVETKELRCYREYSLKPSKPKRTKAAPKRTRSKAVAPTEDKRGKRPRQGIVKAASKSASVPVEAPTRTGRIRRTPSHLIEDDLDTNTSNSAGHLFQVRSLLLNLINNDKEGWFIVPVDAEALGLNTYHKVIKKPMDLGTIKKKMEDSKYSSQDEVVEDIRLVFNNACTFNPVGHPVNRVASQHLKIFESELKKLLRAQSSKGKKKVFEMKKEKDQGRRKRLSKLPKKIAMNKASTFDSSSEDDDDESESFTSKKRKVAKKRTKSASEDSSEVKVLRKQVEMMNKQIELMQQVQEQNLYYNSLAMSGQQQAAQTISAPPAVQTKKKEGRPLSYQEKRQLGQDIHKLPGDMIQGVISIIQESGTPLGGDGEEVELDIEALDTPALRKLQKYVRKCLSKARSQKSRQDIDSMIVG